MAVSSPFPHTFKFDTEYLQIFSEIVCLFGSAVINQPEGLLEAEFTKMGRIEHHFYAMNSISIVFIEVKKELVIGRGRLDVVAQILAGMSFPPSFFPLLQL